LDYQATEKLKLNFGITYNKAEDSWDWGTFTERQTVLREDNETAFNTSTAAPGPYAPANYDTWGQNNEVDSYSDLSYEQYQLTVGGTYNFTPASYMTASLTYDKFKSDEMYVYGDEDGEAYYGYIGFGHRF